MCWRGHWWEKAGSSNSATELKEGFACFFSVLGETLRVGAGSSNVRRLVLRKKFACFFCAGENIESGGWFFERAPADF